MDKVKTVALWAGPTVVLLALYMAVWGIPNLAVAVLLVVAGLAGSMGGPKLVKYVKSKLG